jgi:hypothetical protein
MIKVFVHIAKAIIAIAASLLFFSCGFERVNGDGNVITQPRNVADGFTKISVSGGIEVYIAQGNKPGISVEADSNLQEHIKTSVSGGTLTIKTDVNIGDADAKKVTVTLPKIESVESGGGALVKSTTVLKGNAITVSSSSGSSLEVAIEAESIKGESSSGSNLKINGRATNLESNGSSGATLDARNLTLVNSNSNASSGGTIFINVSEKLKANASSGGKIYYVKTPVDLSKTVSSGGIVENI